MAEAALARLERWMVRGTPHALGRALPLEPLAAGLAGVGLLIVSRESTWRVPAAVIAGVALARAASGAYGFSQGVDRRMSTQEELSGGRGEDVQQVITIACPVGSVYAFWRTLTSLAEATGGRIAVTPLEPQRSHWQVRARAGDTLPLVEWTAEVVNDVPDTLLAWRTTADADVPSAGSVHFAPAPGLPGATDVKVHLRCAPPFGRLGTAAAAFSGHEPATVVRETLDDVKRHLERSGRGAAP